jgi:hypothetical protein
VRLLERFLEALRQSISSGLLGGHRLLEERFASRRFLGENPVSIGQFGTIAPNGLDVADDAAQVHVDDERRLTAGARGFELGLERHD